MTLREKQSVFLINVAKFILWINEQPGYTVTGGELWRPDEMQEIYLKEGKSKVQRSKHQDRLAVDLNLFINGEYKIDKEGYKPLADYWESLDENNKAGYNWSWDANHFEMD